MRKKQHFLEDFHAFDAPFRTQRMYARQPIPEIQRNIGNVIPKFRSILGL